jgi:CheY-like chemotaxis protein
MAEITEKKVLLVDDVEFIVDVMKGYLKNTPVKTCQANNGRTAIDMALLHWPDLVIMDVAMPEMGGVEACREMKQNEKLKDVPVILIYDPERDPAAEDLMKSGCSELITKPLAREDFLTISHRYLFHVDRRERRAPCQMTVNFTVDGESYQGLGVDISRSGMYVEFRDKVFGKSNIDVEFLLATISDKMVMVKGRIVWVNQGHPRPNLTMPQGIGIEFQIVSEESKAIINRYLEEN